MFSLFKKRVNVCIPVRQINESVVQQNSGRLCNRSILNRAAFLVLIVSTICKPNYIAYAQNLYGDDDIKQYAGVTEDAGGVLIVENMIIRYSRSNRIKYQAVGKIERYQKT